MLLGIDVGGTFTDAVIIQNGRVLAWAKSRTSHGHLMDGILASLDQVLQEAAIPGEAIDQVTLSTTVVTNAIVSHQTEAVDLYIVPGPGRNVDQAFPVVPHSLPGYTDHRGQVMESLSDQALRDYVEGHKQHAKAAISAKFSVRNPKEEGRIGDLLRQTYSFVAEGAKLSGALNFPRRTVTAYYNAAVADLYQDFIGQVTGALEARGLVAPLYILKADGGSLLAEQLESHPVETAFTGPAASVLGLMALDSMPPYEQAVALDIGGTTTDISLWDKGQPIMTKEGVSIDGYPSSIRSYLVQSIGVAGETAIHQEQGQVRLGPDRLGPSVALGGQQATLGDVLIALGWADFGDRAKAQAAVAAYDVDAIAKMAVDSLVKAIQTMVDQANRQPIYTVEDLVHPPVFDPHTLVLIGGSAKAFKPLLEAYTDYRIIVPEEGAVANAIGAAMARHTLSLTLHVDSKLGRISVPELGLQEENHSLVRQGEVLAYAYELLEREAKRLGLPKGPMVCQGLEDFSLIEGWGRSYKRITAQVAMQAGVIDHVKA